MAELVERDAELGALRTSVDALTGGAGSALLIEGPAGIGKTHLLGELRGMAADNGVLVLRARGSELERDFPFGVVRQLFEAELVDPQRRDELLGGAAGGAGPVFQATDSEGSFAALHGLYWLTLNLAADRPVLLAVDDLHGADRSSLRFMTYLARRLDGAPVMLAMTLRSTEPGVDPALVGELAEDPDARRIRPGPLSEDGSASVVRDVLGDGAQPAFIASCARATGGNPLLLRQLLVALGDEGVTPDAANADMVGSIGASAVSRTLLLRLARLEPPAVEVARAIAVLGEGATPAAVTRLTDIDDAALASAVRALARVEIVRSKEPLGFVHPLLRDAVYHELPASERDVWHERAAQALVDIGAPQEQVAAQLLAGRVRGEAWAGELLWAVARAAVARGAPDSAVAAMRRALDEPLPADQRPQLLLELGRAEALVDPVAAIGSLRLAYAEIDDAQAKAHTGFVLAETQLLIGQHAASLGSARTALADAPWELGDERRALEAISAMGVFYGAADIGELERAFAARASGPSDGVGSDILEIIVAYLRTCRADPADECADQALSGITDRLLEMDDGLFSVMAVIVLGAADRDEVLDVADACRAAALRRGAEFGERGIGRWLGLAMLKRGELTEATELLEGTLDGTTRWGREAATRHFGSVFLAEVALARGDVAAAREQLGTGFGPDWGDAAERRWRHAHAHVLLAENRPAEALAVAEEIAATQAWVVNPACASWREPMAVALEHLDRRAEAVAIAEEDVAYARAFGAPGAIGRALRVLVEVGGPEEALDEAIAVLDGSPARLEFARVLAARGIALRHDRQPTEAREPLRLALDLADRCGADALAATVRAELAAAGVRPRTAALTGIESLTPSEHRVAALAAGGFANREIAQELFVTPKTVEVHLSSAYRKLGIGSRRELPQFF